MALTRRASVNDAHPKAWTAKLKPGVGKLVVARLAITGREYMVLAETDELWCMKEGRYRLASRGTGSPPAQVCRCMSR